MKDIIAAAGANWFADVAHLHGLQPGFQFGRQLSLLHPAEIASLGGGRVLAELPRNSVERRAKLDLIVEIRHVLLHLGVLLGGIHRLKDFAYQIAGFIGGLFDARELGIDQLGRDVNVVPQLVLYQLRPCNLHRNLRAQRRHVDAARSKHGFELIHRQMVGLQNLVDRLVHFGGRDRNVVFPRFQQLHLLGF